MDDTMKEPGQYNPTIGMDLSEDAGPAAERVPAGGQHFAGLAGLTRRKHWDELSADEKIELLRSRLGQLMNHSHGEHGEILAPLGLAGGYPQQRLGRYSALD